VNINITTLELKKLIGNINIIDIREEVVHNKGNIPTSINITASDLLSNPNKYLKRGNKYYIYCNRGITSMSVRDFLLKLGFDAVNVIGGYKQWIVEDKV
jgi:rhodanese-related sulfurtransferase